MISRGVSTIGTTAVDLARLTAGEMEVTLLNYGAITRDWRIGGRSIVLGYDELSRYGDDRFYLGAIVGRVANRIAGAQFRLNGELVTLPPNDGANHLHGGPRGLSKRFWQMESDTAANAVRLSLVSGHGDGGYPGRATFEVIVQLTERHLKYEMRAEVDRPTPINLAQHNYYNLTGGTLSDHVLKIAAEEYLPVDDAALPTGAHLAVKSTALDFRRPRALSTPVPEIDNCLVLDGSEPAATLTAPGSPELRFFTDQPGLQLYTGAHLADPFEPFSALCLEPEGFPDAVNHPGFPSVLVTPDMPYSQRLTIEVA